jgi:hypothetical protein
MAWLCLRFAYLCECCLIGVLAVCCDLLLWFLVVSVRYVIDVVACGLFWLWRVSVDCGVVFVVGGLLFFQRYCV